MSTIEIFTYLDKGYGFVSVTNFNIKIINSKFYVLLLSDIYLYTYIMLEIRLIHDIYQYRLKWSIDYLLHDKN